MRNLQLKTSSLDELVNTYSSLVIPSEIKFRGLAFYNLLRQYTKDKNLLSASLLFELYSLEIYKPQTLEIFFSLDPETLSFLKEINTRMEESILSFLSLPKNTLNMTYEEKWISDLFNVDSKLELFCCGLLAIFTKKNLFIDAAKYLLMSKPENSWIYPELRELILKNLNESRIIKRI